LNLTLKHIGMMIWDLEEILVMRRGLVICIGVAALALALLLIPPLLTPNQPSKPSLSYQVAGCSVQRVGEVGRGAGLGGWVDVSATDSGIKLVHHLQYVCCAEFVVEVESMEEVDGHVVLKILERNVGEVCRCMCEYEVSILISDLRPGLYLVELHGVEFNGMPAEKLWEGEVRI